MTEPSQAPLSPRQLEVLRIIQDVVRVMHEKPRTAPSAEDIAAALDINPSVVRGHIAALYRKGWLKSPSTAGIRCLHTPEAHTLREA